MKMLRSILLVLGIALVSLTLPSCLKDDNSYSLGDMWIAIATVVPQNDNSYYLRLDDGKKLWPAASNYPNYEPKADQRAFINFTILSDSTQGFAHYIKVNAIHNILTKPIAENKGTENDSTYGIDPVSIPSKEDIWVGDGYLNVYFMTSWGGVKAHFINLIQTDAAKNPYELEFRHNAYDDPKVTVGSSRVAFNLSSLPDTKGETVDLKIKVWTLNGIETYTVKYNTDKEKLSASKTSVSDESVTNMENIK